MITLMVPGIMVVWIRNRFFVAFSSRFHGLPESLGMIRWRDILHFSLPRQDPYRRWHDPTVEYLKNILAYDGFGHWFTPVSTSGE